MMLRYKILFFVVVPAVVLGGAFTLSHAIPDEGLSVLLSLVWGWVIGAIAGKIYVDIFG